MIIHLKCKQDVQTHYTNQNIKNALASLKQYKYEITFSQMKELRDVLDDVVLNAYGNRRYDGTNGNGYQPLPSINDNPTPPKAR